MASLGILVALLLCSALSVTAQGASIGDIQECATVSAHPEGKIVCRSIRTGKDQRPVLVAQGTPSVAAIQQIEQMITKYGKNALIDFIRAKKAGQITLAVGNGYRKYYGSPDPIYVTP